MGHFRLKTLKKSKKNGQVEELFASQSEQEEPPQRYQEAQDPSSLQPRRHGQEVPQKPQILQEKQQVGQEEGSRPERETVAGEGGSSGPQGRTRRRRIS